MERPKLAATLEDAACTALRAPTGTMRETVSGAISTRRRVWTLSSTLFGLEFKRSLVLKEEIYP
jgi:hypothetical protein